MRTGLIILIVIVLIAVVIFIIDIPQQKKNRRGLKEYYERKKRNEEEDKRYQLLYEEQQKKEMERKELRYKSLVEKMAYPNKIISLPNEKYIMVNEKTKQILIEKGIYSFHDILGYELFDNQSFIEQHGEQKITSTTKTNTQSMVGRAIVGGILMGGVGAIAGAATAKKNTDSALSGGDVKKTVIHNYSILVTVNNINQPLEKIYLYQDKCLTDEICAILSVILMRNKQDA